jgi:DNA-binding transcriptional ArsR family regulator
MSVENVQPPRRPRPPRVVDVSRPGPRLAVEIDASEAVELLLGIATLTTEEHRDTYELGAARIDELRAAAPPELLAAAEGLLPGAGAAQLLGLVYTTPKPRTAAAFLDHLAASEPLELRLHMLGYYMRGHHIAEPETIRRAAEGDAAASRELLGALAEFTDKCETVERLLRLDPDEAKQSLVALLSDWHDRVFPQISPDVAQLAERDAAAKRELVRAVPPEQVVERLAPGVQWVPGPDVDSVVLFPAYAPRPWVYMSEYRRVKIFCYPISVDREPGAADAPAELARVYKALADESRLKLLRRLSAGPITLAEAAKEVGLAKSTAHHHLALLRQAGFVLIREDDDLYSLRPDVRPEPGALLESFLRS